MEPHEAMDWLHKRRAWERWLTELWRGSPEAEAAERAVTSLEQQRQRSLSLVLSGEWWSRRSA